MKMSNPELLKAEESVKEKYIELVKTLSFLELKGFNRAEYAGLVLSDMVKLLLEFDKSPLRKHAYSYILKILPPKKMKILR